MKRSQAAFDAVSEPLKDYLLECPAIDEEDAAEMLRAINPLNKGLNYAEHLAAMAVTTQELHDEGCFLGDVARTAVTDMTPHDEDVLLAVCETAAVFGDSRVRDEEADWCVKCQVAFRKTDLDYNKCCAECR